ncbi:hypothetical protein N8686_02725 [Akkermansiaceae bacterium]|nr:hypothetical protein [Akkermansiaceae bacterium]
MAGSSILFAAFSIPTKNHPRDASIDTAIYYLPDDLIIQKIALRFLKKSPRFDRP